MIFLANHSNENKEGRVNTYDIISKKGIAWMPQVKRGGGRYPGADVMLAIHAGDYILCKNGTDIHAIGIAKSSCYKSEVDQKLRSGYDYDFGEFGYEVKVEYIQFDEDVAIKSCSDEIRRLYDGTYGSNHAFNKDGNSNESYINFLQPEHAVLLLQKSIEKQKQDNYKLLSALSGALNEATNDLCNDEGHKSKSISESRNKIYFGAPGTGKSFQLDLKRKEYFGSNYERVTFHPEYSYANFVGTYKPVMRSTGKDFERGNIKEWKIVIDILTDKGKNAQQKYDAIYDLDLDIFKKGENSSRLPLLVSLYSGDSRDKFKARDEDGHETTTYNNMINHGKSSALRNFVKLYSNSEDISASDAISYEFVPGPFLRVYVEAKSHPEKPYLLIIEEINRADVAAVFGDVFQLLDRVDDAKDGTVGESRYPVHASNDVKNYLAKELGGNPVDYSEIRIPENMYIWATMNSADQGVFPLDTAFKRRWDFEYIGINDAESELEGKFVRLASGEEDRIEWNCLRKAINDFLATKKINEDKQLGPYFISHDIVVPDDGNEIDSEKFTKAFKDKVIMYLYEDAGRQIRSDLFSKPNARYSELCNDFCCADDNGDPIKCDGIKIFCAKIIETYNDYCKESNSKLLEKPKAEETEPAAQKAGEGGSDDSGSDKLPEELKAEEAESAEQKAGEGEDVDPEAKG